MGMGMGESLKSMVPWGGAERAKSLASIFGGGTTTVADVAVVGSAQKMKEKFAPQSTKAPVLAHMTPVGMVPNVDRTLFTQVPLPLLGGWECTSLR